MSQKEIFAKSSEEIITIVSACEAYCISNASKKLNIAKDFQNFNDKHGNISTISTVRGEGGADQTVIESEIGLKGLTEAQKQAYAPILEGSTNKPSWYTSMSELEQKLCDKYAPVIIAGEHTLSSQLRKIPGMRNAFEKVTSIVETSAEGPVVKTLHKSKHAGSLAAFPKDADSKQELCDLNAEQAQQWIGSDKRLHCNTFNSEFYLPFTAGLRRDPEIVKQTRNAMSKIKGKATNTAFNDLRIFGKASNYGGANDVITEISNGLGNNQEFNKIKSYLNSDTEILEGAATNEIKRLQTQGLISEKSAEILEKTIDLSQTIKTKSHSWFSLDPENASLAISTKINQLANCISRLDSEDSTSLHKIPKEEILNMCASGKDRTGVAEHDQSVNAISKITGISVEQLDEQLISSGHTSYFTGGVNTGGGSIGCYGTKAVSLPRSRQKDIHAIQELSANGNNLEILKTKLFDKKYKRLNTSNVVIASKLGEKTKLPPECVQESTELGKQLKQSLLSHNSVHLSHTHPKTHKEDIDVSH